MAKSNLKVVGIKPSTVAMFEGTFLAIVGLGVAILHTLSNTFSFAQATDSVFAGLAFGMATGIVSIIVVPFVYFGIGWLIGYLNGWIINVVMQSSGGIVLDVEDKK